MISGIYKITSPTGKIYIGQSIDVNKRKSYYMRHACKRQLRLYNSLFKYGFENHLFEIVEYCGIDNLNDRERFWQEHYDVLGQHGLNCKYVGTASKKQTVSKETRAKLRKAKLGTKLSPEVVEEIRIRQKKIADTPEHKARFSKVRGTKRGDKMSEASKIKMSLAKKGRPALNKGTTHRPESIAKMSAALKGRAAHNKGVPMSEEQKKKVSEAKKGKRTGAESHFSKITFDTSTGIYYESVKEACTYAYPHMDYRNFKRHLNGEYSKNKTTMIQA